MGLLEVLTASKHGCTIPTLVDMGNLGYIISYCDTFDCDVLEARDYLESAEILCLHIEDDYSLTSIQGPKTRIGASWR